MGAASTIGTSAGDETSLNNALKLPVDYVAFGPVFPTTTKQTSAPPIGVEGVRNFRKLAGSQAVLVAAAGITLETAPTILAAGANSVAVASAIFRTADPAAEFRRWVANLT
jgi:thiamine-phosphate pyrophosphorylase